VKLLYILPEYLPSFGGGIISHYSWLLPTLAEQGHDVRVLVANHTTLDRSSVVIDKVKVEYLSTPFVEQARNGLRRLRGYPTLWAFLPIAWGAYIQAQQGEAVDIVESTDWMFLMAPWVASTNAPPTVVSLHGSCGQMNWYECDGKGVSDADFVRLLETSLIQSAACVHANSEQNARFWQRQTGRQIDVIAPAFHMKSCISDKTESEPNNRGLAVGRFQNWKGVEVLCQALRLAVDVEIDWIGRDCRWGDTSKSTYAYLNEFYPDFVGTRLNLLPPRPHAEILRSMRDHAFLCAPSTWDVFNLTVAEAMAVGTPVICSDAAGAEMLVDDKKSGYVFPSNDPDALAECLVTCQAMSNASRKLMGDSAKSTVERLMCPKLVAEKTLMSYQQLVTQNPLPPADEWLRHSLRLSPDLPIESQAGFFARNSATVMRNLEGVLKKIMIK
jgi:glycosyltransferase involved in cell wall biosynthesis